MFAMHDRITRNSSLASENIDTCVSSLVLKERVNQHQGSISQAKARPDPDSKA
jgi:hypothetical protein